VHTGSRENFTTKVKWWSTKKKPKHKPLGLRRAHIDQPESSELVFLFIPTSYIVDWEAIFGPQNIYVIV
jgi:hypothetical protein